MGRPSITLQDDQEKLGMKYNALKRRYTTHQANEVIELLREAIGESEQQQQQQPRATSWHGSPINPDLIELSSGEEEEGDDDNDAYVISPAAGEQEGQPGTSGI